MLGTLDGGRPTCFDRLSTGGSAEGIPAWVAEYVGLPFKVHGRHRDGVDCWGLVRLVLAERFRIEVPIYADGYAGAGREDAREIGRLIEERMGPWRAVVVRQAHDEELAFGAERPGDALLIRQWGQPMHVGLVVAFGWMLHVQAGIDASVERYDGVRWAKRVIGIYRQAEGAPCNLPVPVAPLANELRLVGCLDPFSTARLDRRLIAGGTIAELLEHAGADPILVRHGHAWISDAEQTEEPAYIPRQYWHRVRPHAGTVLTVRAVPTGGGGGKNPLAIVLSLAVFAFAAWAAPALVGAVFPTLGGFGLQVATGLVSGIISMVGRLLVNAIAPPQLPKSARSQQESPTYSLAGARNRANPYGSVPRLYGKHRLYPAYGALPYTELVGDDQYLRLLFCLGYGPLQVDDLKIGETPLAQFTGVEHVIRQGYLNDPPLTLYTTDVFEDALSVLVTQVGGWVTRTSQSNADELSLDITFDRGLTEFLSSGQRKARSVTLEVEYRPLGGAFVAAPGSPLTVTDNKTGLVRRGLRWTVARGQYDVQVRRTSADSTGDKIFDRFFWTSLRTVKQESPLKLSGTATVEMRIKASDQLNGVVDTFNCIATSILDTWNGAAWVASASRNAAWAYVDVLRGRANKRPVADARLDLAAFQAWAAANDAAGQDGQAKFSFDGVFDTAGTVFEALRDIAATARAAFTMKDGKFGVVRDVAQTVPIQHFSPRNSFGFRGVKAFAEEPHAVRARFVNESAGWQPDEITVYADGFNEGNATRFETIEFFGVTRQAQAWRDTRYHQAVARLRPETYEISCDVEHLVCGPGDLVRVSHDVPSWGLHWGRIKSVTIDGGGNATAATLDEPVVMDASKSYGARIRKADGTSVYASLVTAEGESATVTFLTPLTGASVPAAGDLEMVGEANLESVELVVRKIEPEGELGARLTLVDAAPAVHSADTGSIPAFDPRITIPTPPAVRAPAKPAVLDLRSDETVLLLQPDGSLLTRILVIVAMPAGTAVPAAALETQFRRSSATGSWERLSPAPGDATEVSVLPVDDGEQYDVRIRAVSAAGVASDWTMVAAHTVLGKTTRPPDVADLRHEPGPTLRWSYASPPIDFAGFRLRRRPGVIIKWDDAIAMHDGLVMGTAFDLSGVPGGTQVIMVKAVDVAGNESANPAVVIKGIGDPFISNIVLTTDYAAQGYPGAIVDGTVVGQQLKANDTGTLFWPATAGVLFWATSDAATFWATSNYKQMTYTGVFVPPAAALPGQAVLETAIVGERIELLYRSAGDGLFWTKTDGEAFWGADADAFWPALGNFVPWPGAIDLARQEYELRVVTGAGLAQGVVSTFKAKIDVDDILEELHDAAIAAGGTRLPVAHVYRAIENVQLTLQGGTAAVAAKILDKSVAGPLVQCFDGAGAGTAATVDADIQGY